jgi:WD40 repeat protein
MEALPETEADIAVFPQLGHSNFVTSVAFSPDGKWIVSGSGTVDGGTVKVWDVIAGTEILSLQGYSFPLAFSPDGTRIVSGSADKTMKVWDAATGRELRSLQGHIDIGAGNSVAFSPDGTRIVSGAWDGTAKVWDATTGS